MKKFSVSENNNKNRVLTILVMSCLMNNLNSSVKAVRNVSTHLTEES